MTDLTTKCETCRYWSDKLAQAIGSRGMEAYCLNADSPHKGYTQPGQSCDQWEDAPLGAVDSGSDEDPRYGNPYLAEARHD